MTQQSLIAASPAAYADTRPYAVPADAMAAARALVGKSCAFPGFAKATGSPASVLPVILRGFNIVVWQRGSGRFAFLLRTPGIEPSRCRIADVVALPSAARANVDLQCLMDGEQGYGFGIGRGAQPELVAFWSIASNGQGSFLQRQPIHVLGLNSIHCQQPESGE